MKIVEPIVNTLFRFAIRLLFKANFKELKKVPQKGPFMIIANHTHTLDGPVMYLYLRPRETIAIAKKELWNNRFTRFVMNLWRCIPIDRENMDRKTMESAFAVLDEGNILAIAPEGSRSKDGSLTQGKAGVAFIAHKKGVPMVPISIVGFEKFRENFKRCRRTKLTIKVGHPFEIIQKGGRLDASAKEALIDEIMVRLSEIVPPQYRGYYKEHPIEYHLTSSLVIT